MIFSNFFPPFPFGWIGWKPTTDERNNKAYTPRSSSFSTYSTSLPALSHKKTKKYLHKRKSISLSESSESSESGKTSFSRPSPQLKCIIFHFFDRISSHIQSCPKAPSTLQATSSNFPLRGLGAATLCSTALGVVASASSSGGNSTLSMPWTEIRPSV